MSPLRFIIQAMIHHLKDKPKSLEHRAKISASRRVSPEEDYERWMAEYRLALQTLKARDKIRRQFHKQTA